MDLTNAAMLIAVVYGLVQLLREVLPDAWTANSKVTVGLVFVVSIVSVFVVAESVWAHEQVVGGQNLDNLGVWDKLIVALFVGGAAAFLRSGVVKTIRSIGETSADRHE